MVSIAAVIVGLVLMHSLSFDDASARMPSAVGMAHGRAHDPTVRMVSTASSVNAGTGCRIEHAQECVPAPTRRSAVLLHGASAVVGAPPEARTDAVGLARFAPSEWRPARSRPITVLRL